MAEIGKDITRARQLLAQGQLVGMPTETVYGLAANALDPDAVLQIFAVKNRPSFDPLIAHTSGLDQASGFVASIPPAAKELANAFWPGPLTLLLPKKPAVPDVVTSGLERVAVRVPAHPLAKELLEGLPFPLAAPSANPFGYISPTTPAHVEAQLGHAIPYILDGGPCEVGVESTIVGFEAGKPRVYRLGGLAVEALEEVLGTVEVTPHSSSNPAAPGMLKSHYAPRKPVVVQEGLRVPVGFSSHEVGVLAFQNPLTHVPLSQQVVLAPQGDMGQAAQNLFAGLRALDALPVRVILAELLPENGLGRAVNDRLKRAATPEGPPK